MDKSPSYVLDTDNPNEKDEKLLDHMSWNMLKAIILKTWEFNSQRESEYRDRLHTLEVREELAAHEGRKNELLELKISVLEAEMRILKSLHPTLE